MRQPHMFIEKSSSNGDSTPMGSNNNLPSNNYKHLIPSGFKLFSLKELR